MGLGHRTLKRVPLDFQAPLKQVWEGYINPNQGPITCKTCDGTGYNHATRQIAEDFYDHDGCGLRWRYDYGVAPDGTPASRPPWRVIGENRAWHANITQDEVLALVKRGRLMDFTHTWTRDNGWQPKKWDIKGFYCQKCHTSVPQLSEEHYSCTCPCTGFGEGKATEMLLLPSDDFRLHLPRAEEVNTLEASGGMHGHDAINRWILIEARAKSLGVYGKCKYCRGKGEIQPPRKKKKQYKKWSQYEPPTGDGYQLWETCSEGSPISPVFATTEGLAEWCADNATIFGKDKISKEEWSSLFQTETAVETASMIIFEERVPLDQQE